MGRYLRGSVDKSLALATLATNTLLSGDFSNTVNERARISSAVLQWAIKDLTAGEGPIMVGLAHSDYSDAEIEAWIENTGSWNEGDKVQQEIAKRFIREVGVFNGLASEESLNDGRPIKTKLNWTLLQGQTLSAWAFQKSGANLTTGAIIVTEGHVNIFPTG